MIETQIRVVQSPKIGSGASQGLVAKFLLELWQEKSLQMKLQKSEEDGE